MGEGEAHAGSRLGGGGGGARRRRRGTGARPGGGSPLGLLRRRAAATPAALRPALSRLAEVIRYAPVTVTALGYALPFVAHPLDAFGVLVPAVTPVAPGSSLLGVHFTSSTYGGRAPDGCVLLTAFADGRPGRRRRDGRQARRAVAGGGVGAACGGGRGGRPRAVRTGHPLAAGHPHYGPLVPHRQRGSGGDRGGTPGAAICGHLAGGDRRDRRPPEGAGRGGGAGRLAAGGGEVGRGCVGAARPGLGHCCGCSLLELFR